MSSSFGLNLALNNLSFGNVSIALLREVHRRKFSPSIFPIGPIDISAQHQDPEFNAWLSNCINTAQQRHSRQTSVVRLWHIGGSLEGYSARDSRLLTFFELDQLTPTEINILRNQDRVYVTSRFTQQVFSQFGVQSEYVPLGFDSANFRPLAVRPGIKGVTSFLLAGKLEKRKGHFQVLKAWAKRYGNNKDYRLNYALHNGFLGRTHEEAAANTQNLINQALEGKQYWNMVPVPWSPDNATYNSVLQSSDIVIGMSGGEGRDLPVYHAVGFGAHAVAMRAHAYLDYLNDENAVLVSPNGKTPAADGVFFAPNGPFNIGNLFTFADDEFIAACEKAEARARNGLNTAGLALQKETFGLAVDVLLKDMVV